MNIIRPARKNRKTIWILLVITILISIIGLVSYLLADSSDKKLAGYKQRGNEYLMKDNYIGAKEEFRKAVKLDPDNLILYFQLAEACIGLEDYSTAADYLDQAITIAEEGPMDIEQYESLVIKLEECYRITGEELKREKLLQHSLELTDSDRIKELLSN